MTTICLWNYPSAYATPDAAACFEDTDDNWHQLLHANNVRVLNVERKAESPAICGAEFPEGCTTRAEAGNVVAVHGLVLDVDHWQKQVPLTWSEIESALSGMRAIVWTTFSATQEEMRYRVVIPLKTPMPPAKYKALCHAINAGLRKSVSETTFNPGRLGFFSSVGTQKSREVYTYKIFPGQRLDWAAMNLPDEEQRPRKVAPSVPTERPAEWCDDDEALKSALKYFALQGRGVGSGSRHATLMVAACRLWWEWAAPDESFVLAVLEKINANFNEPKPPEELDREVRQSWDRTLGPGAVPQEAPFGAKREPSITASPTALGEAVRKLKKTAGPLAAVLGKVLDKKALGEVSEARALVYGVLEFVAEAFPRSTPEKILALVQPSLDAQRARNTPAHPLPTDADCLAKITQVQRSAQQRIKEAELAREDVIKQAIRRAFSFIGENRSEKYTAEEFAEFERKGHVQDRWIIQHGTNFYFFLAGDYVGPFVEAAANTAVGTFLAPARGRVDLEYMDVKGVLRFRSVAELMRQGSGSMVDGVVHDMTFSASGVVGSQLYVKAQNRRDIPAVHQPQVEAWLRAAVPNDGELKRLQTWIGLLTDLSRPVHLLVLEGPTEVGKNLLIAGLARFWKYPATHSNKFDTASVLNCPLISCDETLPKAFRDTTILRAAVTERDREVKKLYAEPITVRGCLRFILGTNDVQDSLAALKDEGRRQSKDAVAKRFLIVRMAKAGAVYLKGLGQATMDKFVDGDMIAQHAAWLRDNTTADATRLGVEVDESDAREQAGLANEGQRRVLAWITQYVVARHFAVPVVVCTGSTVGVNPTLLAEHWGNVDSVRADIYNVQKWLANAAPERRRLAVGGKRVRFRVMDPALLNGFLSPEDMEEFQEALSDLAKKFPVTE